MTSRQKRRAREDLYWYHVHAHALKRLERAIARKELLDEQTFQTYEEIVANEQV